MRVGAVNISASRCKSGGYMLVEIKNNNKCERGCIQGEGKG